MKGILGLRRFSIAALLVLAVSLLGVTAAFARVDKATVEVFPIEFKKPYVVIKITFPTEISGNLGAVLVGRELNCARVSSNVLICIGPFRSPDPSFLTVYDKDTDEVVLQPVIDPPDYPHGSKPVPTPTSPDDTNDCRSCDAASLNLA